MESTFGMRHATVPTLKSQQLWKDEEIWKWEDEMGMGKGGEIIKGIPGETSKIKGHWGSMENQHSRNFLKYVYL